MRGYRLYFRSLEGGIERRHALVADDDAAAMRVAARLRKGHAMELWEGARMVSNGRRSTGQCPTSLRNFPHRPDAELPQRPPNAHRMSTRRIIPPRPTPI